MKITGGDRTSWHVYGRWHNLTARSISPSIAPNPGLPLARGITTPNHRPREGLRVRETITNEGFLEIFIKNSQGIFSVGETAGRVKKREGGLPNDSKRERVHLCKRRIKKNPVRLCFYTARSIDVVKSYNREEQRSISSSPCTSSSPTAL